MVVKAVYAFVCLLQLISLHSCTKDYSSCGPTLDDENNPVDDEWPWMASLGYYEEESWQHKCGATLVDDKHLITAAHCLKESSNRLKILLGVFNLTSDQNETQSLPMDILNVSIHPKFDETAYFDVAVITTKQITFNQNIRPICLPSEPSDNQNQYQHFLLTVTGWGSTDDDYDSIATVEVIGYNQAHCNRTHVAVSSNTEYQRQISEIIPNYFQSQVLCAGKNAGKDASCKEGDSGGPLFYEDTETQRFILVGVVQERIAECQQTPNIYLRLSDPQIFEFINCTLADTCSREGTWGPWEVVGSCSRTCGGGLQSLKRKCLGLIEDAICSGPSEMQASCNVQKCPIGYTKVAIGLGSQRFLNFIEVIDLSSSKTRCQNLPNFPYLDQDALGDLGFRNNPIICVESDNNNKPSCLFLQNGSWIPNESMNEERRAPAMTRSPFPNDGSKLFVTGGGHNYKSKSTEVLTGNGWEPSTPMPVGIAQHCMVMINSTSVMVIGGIQSEDSGASGETFILNGETRIWTEGPTLNQARTLHHCSMIRKDGHSKEKIVIVVGGRDYNQTLNSTEVFDVGSSEWKRGPELPFAIRNGAMVEDPSGGVVLIGGYNNEREELDTLFRLPHAGSGATWEEMIQKLKTPRTRHTAFLIPDELANCK